MIQDPVPDADSAVAVHEFLARLLKDRETGEVHSLQHYQAQFPGHEEGIAREYAAIVGTLGDAGVPSGDGPRQLGRFRILAELGRGGQGVVYLAEDPDLHRKVALKVLTQAAGFSAESLRRFHREAEAASRLDHPGICTVHEVGEWEGVPYIAMRYVEGESLAQKIAAAREDTSRRRSGAVVTLSAAPADGRQKAEGDSSTSRARPSRIDREFPAVHLVEKVARALQAAHDVGIVHRDVKPGNVRITPDGEPVVVDFGLARVEEETGASLTQSGDLFGTPAYMSPEQVRSDRSQIDARTDVWSLGATLYECLTLTRPFDGPTREGLYRAILNEDPAPVRRRNPRLPAELEVILATALEKDLARRYGSMQEFAEDLRRARSLEPVRAKAPGPWLRLRRWAQRNPVLATATLGLFVLLTAGLAVTLSFNARLQDELRRARAVRLADASIEVQDRDGLLALQLARKAVREDRTSYTVSQLHAALSTVHERARFEGHEDGVNHVVFSPDGGSLLTSAGDGKARLWSVSGELLAVYARPRGERFSWLRRATFSPNGKRVLSAYGSACVWSLDGSLEKELWEEAHVFSAAFSPQGRWIVTTSTDGSARIWDGKGPWDDPLHTLPGHRDTVLSGTFSPDEERLVTTSADGTAIVWEHGASGWQRLATLDGPEGHTGPVWGGSFSGDGERVLTFASSGGSGFADCRDYTARLWTATGELLKVFEHEAVVFSAEFSPEGDAVLTASDDGTVVLWIDGGDGSFEQIPLVLDRARGFLAARFSPSGDQILVTGANGRALVVDRSGREVAKLSGHPSAVWPGAFSPDGRLVATGGEEGTARLWELSPEKLPVLSQGGPIRSMDVSRQGLVATVSPDGRLRLWDPQGALLWERRHPGVEVTVWDVVFSPEGDRIATGPRHGRVAVWDLEGQVVDEYPVEDRTVGAFSVALGPEHGGLLVSAFDAAILYGPDGAEVRRFPGNARSVGFDASGERILAAATGGTTRIWSRDGELLEEFDHPGVHEVLQRATISPAGDLVLTGCVDGKAYLWDLADGPRDAAGRPAPARILEGHEGAVSAVAFSPDGALVATGSEDGTARLWRIDGTLVAILRGHVGSVRALSFTSDGERLLTAAWGGLVRAWAVDPEDLVELADERLAGREMTPEEEARFAERVGR